MILQELSDAFGVSGNEEEVRQIVLRHSKEHVDEVKIDTIGNVLATKKGTGAAGLRVMVTAHMDEVGFMVVDHDSNGLLGFRSIGIHPMVTPGSRLVVGPKKLPGVVGIEPIHMAWGASGYADIKKTDSLRVDIGADSKSSAQGKAPLGAYMTFDTKFTELSEKIVRGKAFDDRVGCAVLIDLLAGDPFPFDLLAAFTVQEEVGLRGATVAAFALEPDVAFALEGTICNDLPQEPGEDQTPVTRLGAGPAISVMDRSMIADRRLVNHLVETAKAHDIPYQIKAPGAGGTDAGAIHQSRAGIPSAVVSTPCRYIHGPAAIMNLDDFNNVIRLMREALKALTPAVLER
ncbi:MAG: M42 family metallopeptidase [Anaerolineae bacterium]|nr:M42 family metallopeptidase [Anaerolineae bacterium]